MKKKLILAVIVASTLFVFSSNGMEEKTPWASMWAEKYKQQTLTLKEEVFKEEAAKDKKKITTIIEKPKKSIPKIFTKDTMSIILKDETLSRLMILRGVSKEWHRIITEILKSDHIFGNEFKGILPFFKDVHLPNPLRGNLHFMYENFLNQKAANIFQQRSREFKIIRNKSGIKQKNIKEINILMSKKKLFKNNSDTIDYLTICCLEGLSRGEQITYNETTYHSFLEILKNITILGVRHPSLRSHCVSAFLTLLSLEELRLRDAPLLLCLTSPIFILNAGNIFAKDTDHKEIIIEHLKGFDRLYIRPEQTTYNALRLDDFKNTLNEKAEVEKVLQKREAKEKRKEKPIIPNRAPTHQFKKPITTEQIQQAVDFNDQYSGSTKSRGARKYKNKFFSELKKQNKELYLKTRGKKIPQSTKRHGRRNSDKQNHRWKNWNSNYAY